MPKKWGHLIHVGDEADLDSYDLGEMVWSESQNLFELFGEKNPSFAPSFAREP